MDIGESVFGRTFCLCFGVYNDNFVFVVCVCILLILWCVYGCEHERCCCYCAASFVGGVVFLELFWGACVGVEAV